MRITQAARYARWSAWTAALLACGVGGVYVRRMLQERQEHRLVPPRVPTTVEEQAAGFAFSKVEGDKTLYTVRASHATQFQNGSRVLLEDVSVTMYGRDGGRFDNMRTQSCDYVPATEMITCGGEVQIDLARADSARRSESAKGAGATPDHSGAPNVSAATMHIRTSNVSFNRGTGMATTDRAVEMRFPQGEGRAVGAQYSNDREQWRLLHDVEFTLTAPAGTSGAHGSAPPGPASGAPMKLTGSSLSYRGDEQVLHLLGPVHVVQSLGGDAGHGARELTSGKLDIELDNELRARKIVASDHPLLRNTASPKENRGATWVSADHLSTLLSPGGWIESANADGNVHADAQEAARETHLDAGQVHVEFSGSSNQPRRLTASEKVVAVSKGIAGTTGATARLETSLLDVTFAPQREGSRIERATTPAATMDWQDAVSGAGATERIHITGQQFEADFVPVNVGAHGGSGGNASSSTLSELHVGGGVGVERRIGAAPPETSTSREAVAHFQAGGGWTSVDQTGNVRLREGEQSALSDRAHFDRAGDGVTLTGSVEVTDASSRTTAPAGTFRHSANEFRAGGPVVTTDLEGSSTRLTNLGSGLAHVLADHLQLNTATGHAVYSGHARLWQGDTLVQADVIELDRASQLLTADGQVRAVFSQAAWSPAGNGSAASAEARAQAEFWHAEAGHMTYAGREARGHLDHNVHARSDQGAIAADMMDLFFAPQSKTQAGQQETSGGQQLIRATAAGNVHVEQSDRQGTAAQANYDAAEGKFVLSGAPRVRDSSGNSTTGRQLTLFFADDRIVVDSEAGPRTLTLHRVEK